MWLKYGALAINVVPYLKNIEPNVTQAAYMVAVAILKSS
jgi:hypothetical protein